MDKTAPSFSLFQKPPLQKYQDFIYTLYKHISSLLQLLLALSSVNVVTALCACNVWIQF